MTKSGKGSAEEGLNKREEILSQEKAWHRLSERKGGTRKGRLRGGGVRKGTEEWDREGLGSSNLSKATTACPLTELLQVLMQYMSFLIKSIAHLSANLHNIMYVP